MNVIHELLRSLKPDLKIVFDDDKTISFTTTLVVPANTRVPEQFRYNLQEVLTNFFQTLTFNKSDFSKDEDSEDSKFDPKVEIESDDDKDIYEELNLLYEDNNVDIDTPEDAEDEDSNDIEDENDVYSPLKISIADCAKKEKSRSKSRAKKPTECGVCGKKFSRSDKCRNHYVKCSGKVEKKSTICQICGKKLANAFTLSQHVKNKHTEKIYNCDLCSFKHGNEKQLHIHKTMVHGDKKYMCDNCDFVTASKNILENHLKRHVAREFMTCTICGKSVLDMTQHMNSHNTEMGKCDICNKEMRVVTIKRHKRQYHGEKKLSCEYCSYRTNHYGNLKAHVNTHLGIKNRQAKDQCLYCDVQTRNMELHVKTYHPEKL